VIDACVAALKPLIGTGPACRAAGKSKATHYRRQRPAPPPTPRPPRPAPANALSAQEVEAVLATLRSVRFRDLAPAQVWATLLDEDCYLCSISTMYRSLRATGEVRERRAQAAHPPRARPELMANAPNQCWSWDITKLRGPDKGVWFDLYVIIDIFSRYVVGWMVAPGESAELAEAFIARAVAGQGVKPGTLNIHADRGTSMTSKGVAELLADLGVGRTHSRPHVSNDNPFSESQFKTLKYCPPIPERFVSLEHARSFSDGFFEHYNHVHHHSGLALLTPADVHLGRAETVIAARQRVLDVAYTAHPERFRTPPRAPQLPEAVWINKPEEVTPVEPHV